MPTGRLSLNTCSWFLENTHRHRFICSALTEQAHFRWHSIWTGSHSSFSISQKWARLSWLTSSFLLGFPNPSKNSSIHVIMQKINRVKWVQVGKDRSAHYAAEVWIDISKQYGGDPSCSKGTHIALLQWAVQAQSYPVGQASNPPSMWGWTPCKHSFQFTSKRFSQW